MSQLSKQALIVENNQSFPNNNAGEITPAVLRTFNTDVIESTVNQTEYTANSGSWNTSIANLNTKTGSYATTGSNSFVGNQNIIGTVSASFFSGNGSLLTDVTSTNPSVNSFTQSQDIKNLNLAAYTQSNDAKWNTLAAYTASYSSSDADFMAFTGSTNQKFTTLGYSTSSLNQYTASNDTKWSTLSPLTASLSSSVFQINAFTASQDTKNSTLGTYTASLDTKNATLATYTASVDSKFTAVGASTASLNAFTASQITKNTTLGNLTGSFATTGSNSFVGKQTINNTGGIAIQLTGSLQLTGSNSNTINGQTTINSPGGNGLTINGGGLLAQGTIVSQDNIYALGATAPNIFVAANTSGTGSQYPGNTVIVAPELYPTDIYGGFSINNSAGATLGGMITQTYSNEYGSNNTFMIIGGGAYNGSDTSIAFPNATVEIWKPTNIKSGLVVTGSVKQNVVPVTIASSTASLDLNLGTYFTLTLANNATTHIKPINLAAGVSATVVITTGTNSSASLSPIMLQPAGNAYNATSGSGKIDVLSLTGTNASNMYVVSAKNLI